jgi:DNA helicase-2/ATP-dependent DNA helicase PcrA
MLRLDRSPEAEGRLENLKEFVNALQEFETLPAFLEHVALLTDNAERAGSDMVSIMTLHAAKGLEFDTVFLPGWEEGLLPHQRSLDEQGRAGLEEERRLAHVGLTRARKRAKIYFVSNRRMHGSWTSSMPSRFLDELPETHVEVSEPQGGFGGFGYGRYGSRFDAMDAFGSNYTTPGWQRAQRNRGGGSGRGGFDDDTDHNAGTPFAATPSNPRAGGSPASIPRGVSPGPRRTPLTIEGELVAKSTGTTSIFSPGDRVFHQKFGNGNVTAVDGNKLTILFDRAGEKRVVDSFVHRA